MKKRGRKRKRKKLPPPKLSVGFTTIDKDDCHHIPELDEWMDRRVIVRTTKGTCRGRLAYNGGWYYCQAGEVLIDEEWVQSPTRFLFRKGQFRCIIGAPTEDSMGR